MRQPNGQIMPRLAATYWWSRSCAVENHDVVMVPRGYHPVVAPLGYDLYYLNVMAGPNRFWVFKNDPAHEWMLAPG